MLVKLTQSFMFVNPAPTSMIRGSVVDVHTDTAKEWVQAGLALPIEKPVETASKPAYETTARRKGK